MTGTVIDAICFDDIDGFEKLICQEWGAAELEKLYAGEENAVDIGLAYYPSLNEYGGFRTLQIVVTDFCRIHQRTDQKEVTLGKIKRKGQADDRNQSLYDRKK